MRVAFKVDRIGYYRLFAPLVEEALGAGADVSLLHRDSPADRSGYKSYQWADPAAVPAFRRGRPDVRQWRTSEEFREICTSQRIDALVTVLVPEETAACADIRDSGVAWVAVQEAFELHAIPLTSLLRADAVCMFSEWWIELAERFFGAAHRDAIRQRLIPTGWPELDAFAEIRPDEVRRRLGVPAGRPVVTLASYKYHYDDPWEQIVFRSERLPIALARAIVHRRLDLWPDIRDGVSYRNFLRAVRSFCDRNEAFMVSKARVKDRPPALERRVADLSLYDLGYHPPTIVEVAAITDVFIGFLSTATLEAVCGGAYALCPLPPDEASIMHRPTTVRFGELMAYREPGSVWNFPGVVRQCDVGDMIRWLPEARLTDLRVDPEARSSYARKFVGGLGRGHAARTWSVLVSTVDRKRRDRVRTS